MVEYALQLDFVFGSLSDAIRRDILKRVGKKALNVSQIAAKYDISFAGISKHLKVLEKAKLITKLRKGKEQMVSASPVAIKDAVDYLQKYEEIWNQRFDRLDKLLIRQLAEEKHKKI